LATDQHRQRADIVNSLGGFVRHTGKPAGLTGRSGLRGKGIINDEDNVENDNRPRGDGACSRADCSRRQAKLRPTRIGAGAVGRQIRRDQAKRRAGHKQCCGRGICLDGFRQLDDYSDNAKWPDLPCGIGPVVRGAGQGIAAQGQRRIIKVGTRGFHPLYILFVGWVKPTQLAFIIMSKHPRSACCPSGSAPVHPTGSTSSRKAARSSDQSTSTAATSCPAQCPALCPALGSAPES